MSTEDESRPAAWLTVLAGPSGVGRDSVVGQVRARSSSVWLPTTVTTRPRRLGEAVGVDRVFVSPAEFDRTVEAGGFLEWAQVGAHRYGTPRADVLARLRAGQPVLLPLDPAGARQVRAEVPGTRLVALVPPSVDLDPRSMALSAPPVALGSLNAGNTDEQRLISDADVIVIHDLTDRAADELVALLGSSVLTPAPPCVGITRDAG